MPPSNVSTEQTATMFGLAVRLAKVREADALLIWTDQKHDWEQLKKIAGGMTFVVAADDEGCKTAAVDAGLDVVATTEEQVSVVEKLSRALLQCVAEELLSPGAGVVAIYGAFEASTIDSVSFIRLDERLGRLTARDLRSLKTRVPLETLKTVMDLAVAIGREGREGKPVGTLFVVGDTRRVLATSAPAGFDPMRGYTRKERNLLDSRVREGIKEIAQLDGAIVVSADGTVEAACRLLESSGANITLSKGLGARHMAAATITKHTSAVAITVSESSGSVRLFQNGRVMLHVEPFRRAMKWKSAPAESGGG